MHVALLGPEGTFTHEAAHDCFDSLDPEFFPSIPAVFDSDVPYAFVPFENSTGGTVSQSVDLLRERDRTVGGEYLHPVRHALLSQEETIEDVHTVRSHPQAISQCQSFLEEWGWDVVESSSTAKAAQEIGAGEAAIASEFASEVWDRTVLRRGVQDADNNTTRFLILDTTPESGEKTSLILEPEGDRPGLLHSMLGCFSGHGINLTHIQSRPMKTGIGEYFFYVEAKMAVDSERAQRALQALDTYCDIEIVGCYPTASPP